MLEKVQINYAAANTIRRSPAVAAFLKEHAEAIARAAGEGNVANVTDKPTRAWAFVETVSDKAKKAEAEHRKLSASLDAGRG